MAFKYFFKSNAFLFSVCTISLTVEAFVSSSSESLSSLLFNLSNTFFAHLLTYAFENLGK